MLGCTHYVFIGEAIKEFCHRHFIGDCTLYDGGFGTAKQLSRIITKYDLNNNSGNGNIDFYTSGDINFYKPIFNKLINM